MLDKFHVSIQLKDKQRTAIKSLLLGSDVLAVLPTGYGKSLIFQILVLVGKLAESRTSALVICPLKSIVRDQIEEAMNLGISAGDVSEMSDNDLRDFKFHLVFASAEDALAERVKTVIHT
jgi:ATP-dependent DNA helicase RecQ